MIDSNDVPSCLSVEIDFSDVVGLSDPCLYLKDLLESNNWSENLLVGHFVAF